jgi:hypothetical protein
MTIDAQWLNDVIALVLARQPETALTEDLASVLETREEVLPWLILRQGAFADDPEIRAQLHALAVQARGAASPRPAAPPLCPHAIARDLQAEGVLRALVAHAIDSTALADTLGALLHRHNQALSGHAGYDFRRRIAEIAPPTPEDRTDAPVAVESSAGQPA